MKLGDLIQQALSSVGITEERVENYLGRPCGCSKRIKRLNRLDDWARRVISGKTEDAKVHLEKLLDDE
jgi:hypothetical protein